MEGNEGDDHRDTMYGGAHAVKLFGGDRLDNLHGEGDMDTVFYTPVEDVIRHCEVLNPPE
jgi:hypothetical protein